MPALMLAVTAGLVIWYVYFLHRNLGQARESLNWLEEVAKGHGSVAAVQRLGPALYRGQLEVSSVLFRRVEVRVTLQPRHCPFSWIWSWWRKQPETLQIEADLHCPPGIELEVYNHRWRGRAPESHKNRKSSGMSDCHHLGPFVLTTRTDWQREITSMLTALVASRECNFLSVRFSRSSPHFVATIPLQALSPGSNSASEFFVVLHELASCGSASKF